MLSKKKQYLISFFNSLLLNYFKLTTIFIPKTVKTIIGKATYGAFSSCPTTLVIYCEYKSALLPTTYGNGWNCVSGTPLTTKYGYTYSDYLAETGAVE